MSADPIPSDYERLDPRTIPYERAARLIGASLVLFLSAIGFALLYAEGWLTPSLRGVLLLLAGAGILAMWIGAFVMPRLVHRYTGYRVDALGLEIRRGVFWRSIVAVARSRIQHLDVTQGPLERKYGLGRLVVHTAGTSDATIPLHGIAHETAMAIRDDLGVALHGDTDGV